MYVYDLFSPHNGIATGNALILIFSPINYNSNFFHRIIINLLLLYRLSYFVFCLLVFCVLLRTRANFVIVLWAVKFARI
jgi:hypothetical protein